MPITLSLIREDLKNIKYYYARKKVFDEAFESTGVNDIMETVNKYNNAIQSANPKLYDLYVSLYLQNHTQESLSDMLGYTPEYVYRLNRSLLKFFQKQFNNAESKSIWLALFFVYMF